MYQFFLTQAITFPYPVVYQGFCPLFCEVYWSTYSSFLSWLILVHELGENGTWVSWFFIIFMKKMPILVEISIFTKKWLLKAIKSATFWVLDLLWVFNFLMFWLELGGFLAWFRCFLSPGKLVHELAKNIHELSKKRYTS